MRVPPSSHSWTRQENSDGSRVEGGRDSAGTLESWAAGLCLSPLPSYYSHQCDAAKELDLGQEM